MSLWDQTMAVSRYMKLQNLANQLPKGSVEDCSIVQVRDEKWKALYLDFQCYNTNDCSKALRN